MLMTTILVAAAIVVYALHRKRDVKFNLKVLGANVSLEAHDGDSRHVEDRHDATNYF